MKIDMHIHSTFSDGELTPLEILNVCNKKSIFVMSITDHDNISGVKQAIKLNSYQNINIIPGIELDAYYPKGQLHILGYNFSLNDTALNSVIKELDADNVRKIKSLLSELKKHFNISFKNRDIEKIFSSDGTVGRPDVAKLCVKYGYAASTKEAFKLLLNPLKDKVVKRKIQLTDEECIKYITDAGGIASIAHPVTIKKDINELTLYLHKLKSYGLSCIEVYHSMHSREDTNNFIKISKELELLNSGGSDYHGPIIKPDIQIGSGKNNNLNVTDLTILNKLLR